MSARTPERWLVQDLRSDARVHPAAVSLKLAKLARDPFAFFRGTLPEYVRCVGPELRGSLAEAVGLITGDLHLENFGTFSADSGEIRFDLNDFDEATRAPLLIDLRRLAASAGLATAVAGDGGTAIRDAIDAVIEGLAGPQPTAPACVTDLLARSEGQHARSLVKALAHTSARGPRFRRSADSPPPVEGRISGELRLAVRHIQRGDGPSMELLDAVERLAGNGSLGRRRYLVLVAEGKDRQTLLDFKEPRSSAWGSVASLLGARTRGHQVERAARALRRHSEDLLATATVGGRLFQVKEHSPHGLKIAADQLSSKERREYSLFTGALLAHAWRHSGQPLQALLGHLRGKARAQLRAQALGDLDRTLKDYRGYVATRERIERALGLTPRAD